jgi:hypothetical protein
MRQKARLCHQMPSRLPRSDAPGQRPKRRRLQGQGPEGLGTEGSRGRGLKDLGLKGWGSDTEQLGWRGGALYTGKVFGVGKSGMILNRDGGTWFWMQSGASVGLEPLSIGCGTTRTVRRSLLRGDFPGSCSIQRKAALEGVFGSGRPTSRRLGVGNHDGARHPALPRLTMVSRTE